MALVYTTLATDTFQRPDGPLGANWTLVPTGDPLEIVNHACCAPGGDFGWEFYTGVSFPADQWAQVTIGNFVGGNSEIFMSMRSSADGDIYYGLDFQLAEVGGITFFSSSESTDVSFPGDPTPGDVWRMGIVGTTWYVFKNGVQVGTGTDNTIASGGINVFIQPDTNTTDATITNFQAGSITQSGSSINSTWNCANINQSMRGLRK